MTSRLVIVAVGKLKEPSLRSLADEYLGRVRRYLAVEELEVKSDEALARAVPVDALRVALEVEGRAYSSTAFSRQVQGWLARGKGRVAFLIGGAEGLPEQLSRGADERVSLSSMTLPHRLARVLLYEQLYRALSLARGEPYARE